MICKFIKKGIVFILPLTILPAIIGLGYYLHRPDSLSLPDASRKILILGDSHTECGINDSLFSNSFNFSESSESYLFCYAKLQMLTSGQKTFDTLLLSVNPRSLSAGTHIPGVYKFNSTLCLLDWSTLQDYLDEMPLYMAGRLLRPFWQEPCLEGGFLGLPDCKLAKDIASRQGKDKNSCITYPLQLTYLQKIVRLCEEKNIRLYFVNVPMYNAGHYFNMDNFYQCIDTNFREIPFLDYGDMLFPDSCFMDAGHLNRRGAEIFSRILERDFHEKREMMADNSLK